MLLNIFSSFDPMWYNLCYSNLLFMMMLIMLFFSTFWLMNNKSMMGMKTLTTYILNQLTKTKMKNMKSSLLLSFSLFTFIIYMNLSGLIPYFFSVTSHIIFTMSMGLPLWMMLIISSFIYSPTKTICHLLPDSAPMWLNPFLVLIESASIIVRPLTLSFRLAANMTAGHIVLTLMSSFSISIIMKNFTLLSILSGMYIMFEMGICIIQAYIFSLLISLYSNDHA